jgi:cytochrome P450
MSQCPYTNLLDPDLYRHGQHHSKLLELREQADAPIIKIDDPIDGIPYWAVIGRDEVDYICKHPHIFSSAEKTVVPSEISEEDLALQRLMLVNMDPPEHGKFRRIARNAFTPKAVEAYRETFERYAKEIIDNVAGRSECEFVSEVAAELPLMAILDLCGVPKEDRKKFFVWTNEMFFNQDEDVGGTDPEAAKAKGLEASINVFAYAADLAQQHKIKPLNNIIGALLDSEVANEKLTDDEFQMFFIMLIAAGNESTRSVIAHGMRLLMENPEQLQQLIDQPELIPIACEEMLRYNPAFVGMQRAVMEDVEVSGVKMKRGDKMILHWHTINLNKELFPDPLAFDVLRGQRMELHREHRAFGIGQHFCLGAHLARLELQIMFAEIIPRLRNPKIARPVEYMRDHFVNGIKSMHITFDAKPSA